MSDTSTLDLREPEPTDWDRFDKGQTYLPPPASKGPDGKDLVFFGQLPQTILQEVLHVVINGEARALRSYTLDPIKLVNNGQGIDGYEIRFTRVSLKPFNKRPGNKVALLLRSAGIIARPQKTAEYDQAVNTLKGKRVAFTTDWRAYNKDTGEKIDGYESFPVDETTGRRKSILKQGDEYLIRDRDGNVLGREKVRAEKMYANLSVKFFVDTTKKR